MKGQKRPDKTETQQLPKRNTGNNMLSVSIYNAAKIQNRKGNSEWQQC
jgi:hypothetical protein